MNGCAKCSNNDGTQNDVWGCSVFCRVRGKTRKRYGDCTHFSENKPDLMKDADELKSCPCCGRAVQHIDNDSPMSILFAVECPSCQLRTAWFRTKCEAAEFWNRRTSEPNTSVLRWTRYDGTPETLPEEGKEVIVKGEKFLPFCLWEGHWVDCTDSFARDCNIGDEWAYLPERDE